MPTLEMEKPIDESLENDKTKKDNDVTLEQAKAAAAHGYGIDQYSDSKKKLEENPDKLENFENK